MKWDPISRRLFLQGVGKFTLALPFLPSLIPGEALAAGVAPARRFVALWQDNGQSNRFWPSGPMRDLGGGVKELTLSSVNGALSEVLSADFDPIRSKMTVLKGLSLNGGAAHLPSASLRAATDGPDNLRLIPTIDQILGNSPKIYPNVPSKRVINALLLREAERKIGDRLHTISFAKSGNRLTPVPHDQNPRKIFDDIFQGTSPSPTNPTAGRKQEVQIKVVDKVLTDFKGLYSSRRISSEDKSRLDNHMTFLSELESRLKGSYAPSENLPACRSPQAPQDHRRPAAEIPQLMTDHFDVIMAAFKCGHSKVATIMLTGPTDLTHFSFLGGNFTRDFHEYSHNGNEGAEIRAICNWLGKKVAEFVKKMNEVEDPATGATYLDNSLVLWTNGHGKGDAHDFNSLPTVLFGGGGFIKTGRMLDYGSYAYNALLVTILQGMGLAPQDYEQNGEAGYGIYGNFNSGDKSKPLIHLTA